MRPASGLAARLRLNRRGPWRILALLVVVQWVAIAVFASIVRHNGWLFYQGGDELFFYTGSWVLSHGHIPESEIGYGWSYLLTPFSLLYGANTVAALPGIVLFQVLLLGPVALLAVYGIVARCAGRVLGYVAVLLWIFLPFLTVPLWDQRYHAKYVENFLPQALGLTGLGDYPSMVFLLVAAYFCVRAFDSGAWLDGALAGLAAGFAIGIKPANVLFLAGPVLAFPLARRLRPMIAFGAGILPAALALALWKYRGLGHLPLISPPSNKALAAGASVFLPASPPLGALHDYLQGNWAQLQDNLANFREFFWSVRVAEWFPVAGGLAVARRSPAKAVLLGGWFLAFFVVKGMSPGASVEGGTFLRLFMPGFPPFILLTAAIPVLYPEYGPRLAARFPVRTPRLEWRSRPVIAAAAVFAALPLLLFLVLRPFHGRTAMKYFEENVVLPVDTDFKVSVHVGPDGQRISWQPPPRDAARVFFHVFRVPAIAEAPDPTLPPGREGVRCLPPTGGAADCRLEMQDLGTTRRTSWHDPDHLHGRWTYRVGMAGNWEDNPKGGDVLVLSPPATISGR